MDESMVPFQRSYGYVLVLYKEMARLTTESLQICTCRRLLHPSRQHSVSRVPAPRYLDTFENHPKRIPIWGERAILA